LQGKTAAIPDRGVSTVDFLRRAKEILAESGDPQVVFVVEGLQWWLQNDGMTFDVALGLTGAWRAEDRRRRRDRLIQRLALAHFGDSKGRARALAIAKAARRYRGTSWPRDRHAGRRPDGLNGVIFEVLSLGPFPSEPTLRRILVGLSDSRIPLPMNQRRTDDS